MKILAEAHTSNGPPYKSNIDPPCHFAIVVALSTIVLLATAAHGASKSTATDATQHNGNTAGNDSSLCLTPLVANAKTGLDGLSISTEAGHSRIVYVKNPLVGAKDTATPCWLTPSQAEANTSCKSVQDKVDPSVKDFTLGYCAPTTATSPGTPTTKDASGAPVASARTTQSQSTPSTPPSGADKPAAVTRPTTSASQDGSQGTQSITTDAGGATIATKGKATLAAKASPQSVGSSDLASADVIYIKFAPTGSGAKTAQAVLRLETSTGPQLFNIVGVASATLDPRYRLTFYAGVSILSSAGTTTNNFSDTFPELRLLLEHRLIEGYEECRSKSGSTGQCDDSTSDAKMFALRTYGDIGLSSTTVRKATGTDLTAADFSGTKAFDGTIGLGVGRRFNLSHEDAAGGLTQITLLGVARYGIRSLPESVSAEAGLTPAHDGFGIRIENENGTFQGAYFEVGLGETQEYNLQRTGRLKFDGFLPFTNGAAKLAARLQIDTAGIVHNNPMWVDAKDSAGNELTLAQRRDLLHAGQIKITFLTAIDVAKVVTLLKGSSGAGS